MRGTRQKLSKGKKTGITPYIRQFSVGQPVHIDFLSSSPLPHPRFHGTTGKVLEKRGKSYVVQFSDKNAVKKLVLRPEHLRPQINKGD